jgi:hypothetical protein
MEMPHRIGMTEQKKKDYFSVKYSHGDKRLAPKEPSKVD